VRTWLFFYLDASALAKRDAPEVGTPVVNHLFARVPPDRFIVFNVGIAEVVSLLVRKKNANRLPITAFSQALIDVGAEIVHATSVRKIAADNTLVTAALPLIETYSINATDGIILRSALDLAAHLRTQGHNLILMTSDQRLLKAAQAEGLLTFNPEMQTEAELDLLLVP
jgi:predicted nucleic acid-binding protein